MVKWEGFLISFWEIVNETLKSWNRKVLIMASYFASTSSYTPDFFLKVSPTRGTTKGRLGCQRSSGFMCLGRRYLGLSFGPAVLYQSLAQSLGKIICKPHIYLRGGGRSAEAGRRGGADQESSHDAPPSAWKARRSDSQPPQPSPSRGRGGGEKLLHGADGKLLSQGGFTFWALRPGRVPG
jgi:hypothetical protein